MEWKITGIETDGDLITQAHYYVSLSDDKNTVDHQGTHSFYNPQLKTPLSEVKEKM